MLGYIILYAIVVLFAIMGGFLLGGRGSWLIAGYNTMSPKEKARFNQKALCKAMGGYLLFLSVITLLLALFVEKIWVGVIYTVTVLVSTVTLVIWLNKSPRFRNQ